MKRLDWFHVELEISIIVAITIEAAGRVAEHEILDFAVLYHFNNDFCFAPVVKIILHH